MTSCPPRWAADEDEAPKLRRRALCGTPPTHPEPPRTCWFGTPREREAQRGGWGGKTEPLLRMTSWSVSPWRKASYSQMGEAIRCLGVEVKFLKAVRRLGVVVATRRWVGRPHVADGRLLGEEIVVILVHLRLMGAASARGWGPNDAC
jgi:hypothetical protein